MKFPRFRAVVATQFTLQSGPVSSLLGVHWAEELVEGMRCHEQQLVFRAFRSDRAPFDTASDWLDAVSNGGCYTGVFVTGCQVA